MSREPKQWDRSKLEQYFQQKMSRRSFGKGALAATAGAVAAPVLFESFNPKAVSAAQRALAQTQDSATAAVEAAKQFSGTTLNVVWEAGLQAEDPKNYSGPKFEELTGIKINTVEKPFTELFQTQVAEHIGQTGAYDVLSMNPSWMPDLISQGIVEPLQPFLDQYGNPADLEDYHPL